MSVPFSIWLRGTDTYFASQSTAGGIFVVTGAADAAPNTIGEPSLANGWIEVEVIGLDPTLINEGEEYSPPSRAVYDDVIPRWTFKGVTTPFRFPDAYADYYTLLQHLSKRYLYFTEKVYDEILSGGGASGGWVIPVQRTYEVEHNYDNGSKAITMNFKHRDVGAKLYY